MADDLKRVGLVFKEEGAVDFKKTLQEINIEMNKNYNQFKLTQSQWNDSTKSTEKLRQEQEYLKNAYEIQADKVSTLRMQLSDLENAENKNITAIKKKQNELTNAEIKLQNYKNKLDKTTTSLENIKNGFETTTEKLSRLNNEIKENESNFNLAKSQWNAMTKESEKLKTEQQYLTEAYRLQSEKLNILKTQLTELENAEDKNTDAISKKKQEIVRTETELNNYNTKLKIITNQLENFSAKMISVGEKIENIGGKIEGAGKKMSAFSVATGTALVACAKSAIDFEDAFTGVEKTVDGTEQQMAELKQGIRNMAKEIPSTTTEISAVAEAAGQLGIKTEDILSFTRVMIDLGNSTNLSAEEAASALAKFANITNMSAKDYDKLGSTIVALGNNFATTEADIVSMATRLAATGELAGLSQSQILSLATAMSSVGIEAEAGGSAMSKLLKKIQVACETGSGDLKKFAKVSGMTSKQFKQAFEKDAVKALSAFISGLNDTKRNGKSAIAILDDMDIKEIRLSNTILSLANASNLLNDAVELGNKSWEDNTALTDEANKRYNTLKSQIEIALNKLKDLAITVGEKLMPYIEKLLEKIEGLVNWFSNLSDEQVEFIMNIGLVITAIGPLLTIVGKLTSVIGGAINGLGTFVQAIGVVKGTVKTTSTAVNGLADVLSVIGNPVGIAILAITSLSAEIAYLALKETEAQKEARLFAEEMENSRQSYEEYNKSIDKSVESNIEEINSVSRLKEELKTLVNENGEVKKGYESRVSFILNQLNGALGTEYELNGNIVQSYKELQAEIDNTIAKKKAEIVLNGEEEKWANAKKIETSAVENLKRAQEELNNKMEEYGLTYDELKNKAQTYYDMANNQWITGGNKIAIETYKKQADSIQNVINAYENATSVVKQCTEDKKSYENDYALFVEGKYNEIGNIVVDTTKNWTQSSLLEIQKAISQEEDNLKIYKQIYEQTGNEIALQQQQQAQQNLENLAKELKERTSTVDKLGENEINAWKNLAINSYDIYYDTISPMDDTLRKKIEEMTGVVAEQTPELVSETAKMSEEVLNQIKDNPQFKQEAINNLTGLLNGLKDEELRELLKEAGVQNIDKVIEGVKEGNLAEDEGVNILNSLNEGLNNKTWKEKLFSTARSIASALSGLLTIKANVNGDTSKLPGHKNGLDYVPHDDYVARLHKGERVLTKEENKEYTQEQKSGNNKKTYNSQKTENKFTMNVYCEKLNNEELDRIFNYMNKRFGVEY